MTDWKEMHEIIVALRSFDCIMSLMIFRGEPLSSVILSHVDIIVALDAAD